ncbi:hypothetical protein ACN47E_002727 [Coniothyrium glycines]
MPRQLPWAHKGGGSKTQLKKQPPRIRSHDAASDIDADFFEGTVLATDPKERGRAPVLDDDLPDFPEARSRSRPESRSEDDDRTKRAPSSSPPPVASLNEPVIEPMRKGMSNFDLRDDEWMMVEDEFLETAKLFTRHLHIARYEELKEQIEKKKEEAEISRPVVPNSHFSDVGAVKEKARLQEKRQRKAMRDVFASQHDEDGEIVGKRTTRSFIKTATKSSPNSRNMHDTDSDDLDTAKPVPKRSSSDTLPPKRPPPASTIPASSMKRSLAQPPSMTSARMTLLDQPTTFKKPALHGRPKARLRPNRATPFDMLDDYARKKTATPLHTPERASPPAKSSTTHSTGSHNASEPPPSRSSLHPAERASSSVSQVTSNRFAERKAVRENQETETEKDKKRKRFDKDDIPTFLF